MESKGRDSQPDRHTQKMSEGMHEDRASRQYSLKGACLWKKESFLLRYSPRDRISCYGVMFLIIILSLSLSLSHKQYPT